MSDEDFYDDDFCSDEDKAGRNNTLMPIVEVPTPSDQTPRSEQDLPTNRSGQYTNRSDQLTTDSSEEESPSPRPKPRSASGRKSKKVRSKTKTNRHHVDMTEPEQNLKQAERKAHKYIERKKIDKGTNELIRCTALARIVYGDGHWKLAKAYLQLADSYLDHKGYAAQAQYHADAAKSIMTGRVQMSDSSTDVAAIMNVTINTFYTLGRALTIMKKYQEAEQCLTKASRNAKDSSLKKREMENWNIKITLAIAKLSAKQQKYAMASTNFEKALDLMEEKYGQDAVELIPVYQSLGKVEQSKDGQSNHEKAINHYLQAHSIASAKYKSNSVEVADTARALAMAYGNIADEDAKNSAESYYNECLGIYQAVHGPYHEKTITVEDELARLMISSERTDEGVNLLGSSLDAKKEVYGDLSPEVSDTLKLMGNVHLANGDGEKALRSFRKCHNIESSVYGTNHKKTKDTQRTIDLLMANPNISSKQKKSKAEEMKERPRFNSIVSRSSSVGACKVAEY